MAHVSVLCLLVLMSGLEPLLASSNDYGMYNLTDDNAVVQEKHHIFGSCRAFHLEPDEYVMFSNGTAYVEAYNKTYNSSFYLLHEGGLLTVCAPQQEIEERMHEEGGDARYHLAFLYLNRVCLSISIGCLLIHLLMFCLVADLRNLPGYNMASLCVALILSSVSFLVASGEILETSGTPCVVLASMTQFFFLASFMWMGIMAFDVFRSLMKATGKLRLATRRFILRRFLVYSMFAWGFPLVFVIAAIVLDNLDGVPEMYRPMFGEEVCWFRNRTVLIALFAAPIFAVIIANIVLFCASAYIIYSNRMKTEGGLYRTVARKNFTMHYRLATIMGLTWVIGFANASNSFWLLYIYVLLTSLQGLFIFLACTCTAKVRTYIKKRLNLRVRKESNVSVPTFQSYWNEEFPEPNSIYIVPTKDKDNAL